MRLVVAAWTASALVFSTFFMKTMLPLRVVAIASNIGFMSYALLGLAYGDFGHLYPVLVLHSCLLPLNVPRLRQLRHAVTSVAAASDEQAIRSLAPYMTAESYAAGDTVFRRGEPADRLYVIREGTVTFPERGGRLGVGAVFGEVGLFAPTGRRTGTAVCVTDCQLLSVGREKALELCQQDPRLAMVLLRVVAGYVPVPDGGASPEGRAGGGGVGIARAAPEPVR
jgi:CRP/FNR family transcriptional regulator, cyclic AMP receptor protein